MKLKIAAGAAVVLFAVAGVVVAAKQDQSASENGQEFSQQSTKSTKKDQKPNGTAGSSFQRLGF